MTNREFLTIVAASDLADEVKTHAAESLAALDARNAARREKPSKSQLEALARYEEVAAYFMQNKDKVATRDEIGEVLGMTGSQVTAAVKAINEGKVNTLCRVKTAKAKIGKSTKTVYGYTDEVEDEGE